MTSLSKNDATIARQNERVHNSLSQHQGAAAPTLLRDALLATRIELAVSRVWKRKILAERHAMLLELWAQRPKGLFESHGTAESIERFLQDAFAFAGESENEQAARALRRAYFLVCCTLCEATGKRVQVA